MDTVISIENVWKRYQLGVINNGHFYRTMQSRFALALGKEDPWSVIGKESRFDKRGSFWALKDINLSVKKGDCLAVLGRNGAGKSTLLKIITRITTPTRGQIKIKGNITSLLEVGTGFHHELTGRENVYLNGAILGLKKEEIKNKFEEIVEFSEIGEFIDTPVKRYSSGMKIRLAFSVAANLDSEILITDEVLAVGDATFRKKCIDKMLQLRNEESRTMLFVSHNLKAVKSLCTSAVILEKGEIIARHEDIDEAVDQYLDFLGIEDKTLTGDEE